MSDMKLEVTGSAEELSVYIHAHEMRGCLFEIRHNLFRDLVKGYYPSDIQKLIDEIGDKGHDLANELIDLVLNRIYEETSSMEVD